MQDPAVAAFLYVAQLAIAFVNHECGANFQIS